MKIVSYEINKKERNGAIIEQSGRYIVRDCFGLHLVYCASYGACYDFEFQIANTSREDIRDLLKAINSYEIFCGSCFGGSNNA